MDLEKDWEAVTDRVRGIVWDFCSGARGKASTESQVRVTILLPLFNHMRAGNDDEESYESVLEHLSYKGG